MITHRASLDQALADIEAGSLPNVSTLVVSRRWWTRLSAGERQRYQTSCERQGIGLQVDDLMSTHLVEVRGGDAGPPLSSERPA